MKPRNLPVWGWHEPVTQWGMQLGSVVQVEDEWRPVCTHAGCYRPLPARGSRLEARADLREHWTATHRRAAA